MNLQPETTYSTIVGQIVANRRRQCHLDQGVLAQRMNVSQPTLSKIERGDSAFTIEQLTTASQALSTTPGKILAKADGARLALETQGIIVHDQRPSKTGHVALALLSLAALALLIGLAAKK